MVMSQYQLKRLIKKAFSVVEMGVVLLVIAIIVGLTMTGASMVEAAKITNLRSITSSAPIYDIEGNTFWIDIASKDAFTTYPQDKSEVSEIFDTSPYVENNIELQANSTSEEPVFMFDNEDGLPYLLFDGDDMLRSPNSDISGFNLFDGDEITIFVVQKYNENSNAVVTFRWYGETDGDNEVQFFLISSSDDIRLEFGNTNDGSQDRVSKIASAEVADFVDNWHITTVKKLSSGQVTARVDGSQLIDIDNITDRLDLAEDGQAWIGQNLIGGLREIIIYNKTLSIAEIEDIERYLSQKWQIPLN